MVKKIIGQSAIWFVLLLMYLPVLVLVAFSFTDSTNVGVWTGFTFDLYPRLFQNAEIMAALGNTLILALISSLVATILGTMGAMGAYYSKKRSRAFIEGVTQIPVVNAEIVIALSLTVLFVFVGNIIFMGFNLFSFWTLLIGHVILALPFVYLNVKPKLQQMDPSLYEAALDLGASSRVALWKIVIPQILPGIFSGFLIAFSLSLDDFIITAFTRGSGLLNGAGTIETLSTLIQAKIKKGPVPPEMRSLTTLIFLLVISVVTGMTIYRNVSRRKKIKTRKGRTL